MMTVSQAAQDYLDKLLTDSEGLQIGLTSGGCTGFKASLDKVPLKNCTGSSIDASGKVFVDPDSMTVLQGANLDLYSDPFHIGLKITPPADFYSCGCGESFAPK